MSAPKNNRRKPAPAPESRLSPPESWTGPLDSLRGRRLALVVTGGVAAYKAAELSRIWTRAGAQVRAVLTENAARFITALTFESLTGQPAYLDMWARPQFEIEHVSLAQWAEAAVVAPATADFLAKMAHGLADDFATTFMLASDAPKIVAPAMNRRMLAAPATVANFKILAGHGVDILDTASGLLACGEVGDGRLADLETIALVTARALGPGDFRGWRLAVSAGSTREPWDDIRFISNRSTGRMGLDLGLAAWLRGAQVTIVAGPAVAALPPLPQLDFLTVETTADMLNVLEAIDYQTLIMAAAPADFRPAERTRGKIKKAQGPPPLPLAANPDILKSLPRDPERRYVGFAAEDGDLINRARAKLEDKKLDLIAANQAGGPGGAFASADNHLWLVYRDGRQAEISTRPKFASAWALLDAVKEL